MKLLLAIILLWCATPADEECGFVAPGTLTANCDGINCFIITENCSFDEYTLIIYNRWGEKMTQVETYDLAGINKFSDSLLTDKKYPAGTYVFWLQGKGTNGMADKKWGVSLVK